MSSLRFRTLTGAIVLCAAGLAGAESVSIPRGTSVDLIMQDGISTATAKLGDTFRTTVVQAIDIDDQPVLPDGTVVVGRVEFVKSSPRAISLTSLRQDDRKRLVELAPKVSTGQTIDTVFIGDSTAGRASTLMGDDVAEDYSNSRLGAREATITVGTRITMELVYLGLLDVKLSTRAQ